MHPKLKLIIDVVVQQTTMTHAEAQRLISDLKMQVIQGNSWANVLWQELGLEINLDG